MTTKVIQVLTFKTVETILGTGGTQSWALDRARARSCKYVVCCRNAKTRDSQGNEPHGSAFLVGLISDVVPSTEKDGRWLIRFSKYALVSVANQWEGRNPVHFYNADDYEGQIDFDDLDWREMPELVATPVQDNVMNGLTIAQAKAGLAISFGVDPSAIEITIRG